jgi:hypothetical protein
LFVCFCFLFYFCFLLLFLFIFFNQYSFFACLLKTMWWLSMADHAWLMLWYRSWNCSDRVVLFVFLFDYGWSCMTYMVVQILELFRQGGVVCFSVWLWLIMHDLYGGTDLGTVQTGWCCLFFCLTMVDHAWLIWWYISWNCSDRCCLFFILLQ